MSRYKVTERVNLWWPGYPGPLPPASGNRCQSENTKGQCFFQGPYRILVFLLRITVGCEYCQVWILSGVTISPLCKLTHATLLNDPREEGGIIMAASSCGWVEGGREVTTPGSAAAVMEEAGYSEVRFQPRPWPAPAPSLRTEASDRQTDNGC